MDLSVLPECYVDTCLIETLVPPSSHYNHQKGSGTVSQKMQRFFSDQFALGILDKDKRELFYLREFDRLVAHHHLELFKHRHRHHYIILIAPAIELFIINNAAEAGISLVSFDLPDTLDELRKVSKSVGSKTDPRFQKLFNKLVEKKTSEVMLLIAWIRYLKEKNYKANIAALKKMI